MRIIHEDIYLYSSSDLTILRHLLWRSFLNYLVSLRSTDKHIKTKQKSVAAQKTNTQTNTHLIQFSSNSISKQNLNHMNSKQILNLYCIVKAFYQPFNHFNRANPLELLPLLQTRITVNMAFSSSLIHPYEATKTKTNHETHTNTTTNQNNK